MDGETFIFVLRGDSKASVLDAEKRNETKRDETNYLVSCLDETNEMKRKRNCTWLSTKRNETKRNETNERNGTTVFGAQ